MKRAVALIAVAFPLVASADRREVYLGASMSPTLVRIDDPVTGRAHTNSPALGLDLSAIYGLTNSIHVGLALHALTTKNLAFSGVPAPLDDGSRPPGTLYEDLLGLGAAALVHYRYDTGGSFAPIGELEVGATDLRYSNLVHNPSGTQLGLALPNASELVWGAGASVGVEYRLSNRFVATISARVDHYFSALTRWSFSIPVGISFVWW